jgi:AmmeMemoRadiSam system protein B
VAQLLSTVTGVGTVAVVSTDLSHYLDVSAAHERDARTARAVVDRAERRSVRTTPAATSRCGACCASPTSATSPSGC